MVRIINPFWKYFPTLVVYTVFCFISAPAAAQVGTAIASGQTVTIDAHGECRKVSNTGSGTRMVFTGTAAEWASFRNAPNGLGMGTCETPCAGKLVGGYCWYLSASGQSCSELCASHGGVNMAGTRDYAGSGGTDAGCNAAMSSLGVSKTVTTNCGGGALGAACGCFNRMPGGTYVARCTVGTTTDTCKSDYARIACACNN